MNVAHKPIPTFATGYAIRPGESAYPHLRQGIVGAWCPFLGRQGAKLYDIGPYKLHGTLTNMEPTTDSIPSPLGTVLDYDGVNEYVDCGDNDRFSFGDGAGNDTPFSISGWFNLNDFSAVCHFVSKFLFNKNSEWTLIYGSSLLYFNLYTKSDTNGHTITRTAPFTSANYLNKWVHIVATYNAGKTSEDLSIYVNSIRVDDSSLPSGTYTGMSNTSLPVQLGYTYTGYYKGQIGPVYIYNHVLSRSEILQLYVSPFAPFEVDELIVGKAPVAGGTIYNITATDSLFLNDYSVKEREITFTDQLLVPDIPVRREEEHVQTDALFLDETLSKIEEHTATDNLFILDTIIKELELNVQPDSLLLNDSKSNEISLSFLDGLQLDDQQYRAIELLATDNLLFDEFRTIILEKLINEGLFLTDSVVKTVYSVSAMLVYALIRMQNPIGIEWSKRDVMGRRVTSSDPMGRTLTTTRNVQYEH